MIEKMILYIKAQSMDQIKAHLGLFPVLHLQPDVSGGAYKLKMIITTWHIKYKTRIDKNARLPVLNTDTVL